MDWRLAMARLQLQLEGLSQAGWRYDARPAGPAAASLVSVSNIVYESLRVSDIIFSNTIILRQCCCSLLLM